MSKLKLNLIVCGWLVSITPLWAQTSTNSFQVVVAPPANTLMPTQSVNAIFVTVQNPSLWTNLTVTVKVGSTVAPLLDDGNPPDATAGDNLYSGNLVVPTFLTPTNFTALAVVAGQDLTVTNDQGQLLPGAWVTNSTPVVYRAGLRPPNDNFAQALKLPPDGALVFGSNILATIEPAEPLHGNDPAVAASVWWTWSPPVNENVLVDTAGSSFAPVLAVYTGASLDQLQLVAWSTNDVVNGLKAHVNFDAVATVTYRIAVAGYDTNGVGAIRLNVQPGGQPDTQPPLVTILWPASEAQVTTNQVTVTGMAKDAGPDATGVSQVQLQVNGAAPVSVTGTTNWSATVTLPVGTNVLQAVAEDVAGNLSPPFVIVVRYVDPPNDDFTNAMPLTGLAGTATANNAHATKEPGEPAHALNEGGHSIWYSFTPATAGTLQLSTEGSDLDTLLALYTGEAVSNLTQVAANDDANAAVKWSALSALLVASNTYYIAVDGYGGATGNVQLHYTFTTAVDYYSLAVLPALGGAVTPPPGGLFAAGTTQIVAALPARDFSFAGWQGSLVSAQNPLSLVMTQNYSLTPTFQLKAYTEGFTAGHFATNLNWSFGGDAPWFLQTNYVFDGQFAARSGPIGDGQQSSLILEVDLLAGTGSFEVKVSSELGWDDLAFYLNGVVLKRWSGEVKWERYQFQVPAGRSRLEWRYSKDPNFSAGLDAAFLDDLYLPLPDTAFAARLAISALPSGQCLVQGQGYPNRSYAFETTSDWSTWTEAFTTTATDQGAFAWRSPPATNQPMQLIRAVLK